MAWAMSMMRFQPSAEFSHFLQQTLQRHIMHYARTIHPQNIGDMVQALAVMRREPWPALLEGADKWMRSNKHRLLPNHTVAYLNVRRFMYMQSARVCYAETELLGASLMFLCQPRRCVLLLAHNQVPASMHA
jgi:hypothetical protein